MNKEEKKLIKEIKKDCLQLKRRKDLTAYGEGMLVIIKMLEGK